MKIGGYLLPSRLRGPHDAGHMCLWWDDGSRRHYRGFWPLLTAVPDDVIASPERQASYFLQHCVPGVVQDDSLIERLIEKFGDRILEVSWKATARQVLQMAALASQRSFALYSFNPASFPGSHNCVTWAVQRLQAVLGEVLKATPNGRISHMEVQLRAIKRSLSS